MLRHIDNARIEAAIPVASILSGFDCRSAARSHVPPSLGQKSGACGETIASVYPMLSGMRASRTEGLKIEVEGLLDESFCLLCGNRR
jgi:hypothetical protein